MRKLTMLLSLILGLMLVSSPVSAQGTPEADSTDVDIQAIAETTLSADLDTMIENLQVPIPDSDLPERFSSAEYVDPTEVTDEDLVLPMEDIAFAEGGVGFNVDYDPQANGLAIGMSSLNFILVDGEISDEDMEDFKDGASGDGEDEDLVIEDIEINGVDGVLISVEIEEDGIISIVQMIAVPVGNTMVLSMVVAASDDPTLDSRTVRADADRLLFAGIAHLSAAADRAQ